MHCRIHFLFFLFLSLLSVACSVKEKQAPSAPSQLITATGTLVPVAEGWANNSVNAVIFRKNSLVTHGQTQYAAFYDADQYMVLAKRKLGTKDWTIRRTPYKGKAEDAHNSISIMTDGEGYLHVSWDHHGNSLHYAKSKRPGSLELGAEQPMTGLHESNVTYPEFYKLPGGELLFIYRDGASGRGNMVINRYALASRQWHQLHTNLIDGEGERNAYWQSFVDVQGTIHVSWVWRESWDVATNHDMCYARSRDGGQSWENSRGVAYAGPIRQANAEVAWAIPQNSELMNQTSMTADSLGRPVIVSYWRPQGSVVPQYQAIYHDGNRWQTRQISARKTPFTLSGGGTKRIPISRPQILLSNQGLQQQAFLLFRDEERGNKASVAICHDFPQADWQVLDLTETSLGAWEPSYDTERWKEAGELHLFVQKVEQLDGEGLAQAPAEMVSVLEWQPLK